MHEWHDFNTQQPPNSTIVGDLMQYAVAATKSRTHPRLVTTATVTKSTRLH